MKINRAASIPLILHDPYFSIWAKADKLYEEDTVHWCGKPQRLFGILTIDDEHYGFLGKQEFIKVIPQQSIEVTATATRFCFKNELAELQVSFRSPLLLDRPALLSKPCTYIDFKLTCTKEIKEAKVRFIVSSDLIRNKPAKVCGGSYHYENFEYAAFGKAVQTPLCHSGDNITTDWGYCYLASQDTGAGLLFEADKERISCELDLGRNNGRGEVILAYDDLLSINYFGEWKRAYWTTKYHSILDAIRDSFITKAFVVKECEELDHELEKEAAGIAGEDYAFLCVMSYRQSVAAHKLICDEEENLIFLSKENDSNGCIGTVDVSYPSSPLYFIKNVELVKGMLRPIFRFAKCPVWEFDFAPHDVGRYPYATGQVYGLNGEHDGIEYTGNDAAVFPFYYMYPKGNTTYDLKYQMPVEECGNMLIMTAAVCMYEKSAEFAKPQMDLLEKWCEYLLEYGKDPGEQLCTDDFAGHLSRNVNLSAKAIMGVEGYAVILHLLGRDHESLIYHNKSKEMAKYWAMKAVSDEHTTLSFDNKDSWSLKYNLVWDKVFQSGLFSEEFTEKEADYYLEKSNEYGIPLDSRKDYTKSDWILWCAALTNDKAKRMEMIAPVAGYLRNTESRVPFSDWYETKTGKYCNFIARSVQGGIFMPMLISRL